MISELFKVNTFSNDKRKLELSKIFFKMGQIALTDKYKIQTFDKFFPQELKKGKYYDFLDTIEKLVIECQNIYNDKIKDEQYIQENFGEEIVKSRKEIKTEKENLKDNNLIPKAISIYKILSKLAGRLSFESVF